MSAQVAPANVTEKVAVQTPVLFKLATFAILLGLAPISTYYLSLKYLWDGESMYAAVTAVFAANCVLVGYIVSAVLDDGSSPGPAKPKDETKKDK